VKERIVDHQDVRRACGAAINSLYAGDNVVRPVERGTPDEHCAWMLCRVTEFMDAGRREKAMRWLGFAQGHLWSTGRATIDEMKEWNRPPGQD